MYTKEGVWILKEESKNNRIRYKAIVMLIIIIGQLVTNTSYFNVSSNENESNNILGEIYITEDNYEEKMKSIVEPYINSFLEYGYVNGEEDANIYYEKYILENSKANIVICHGFCESLDKYHEIIYYFLKNDYNVFGIEHRGHGRSGILGIEDKTQVNVKCFNHYVCDFKNFMDEIVMPNSKEKEMFLYCHSMGGGIGAKFLEDYDNYFDAAVLSSPMLGVYTAKVPNFVVKFFVNLLVILGRGGNYVDGIHGYAPEYNLDKWATTSVNRYKYYDNIVSSMEEFQKGGPSYNWVNESMNATKEIIKKKNASKIKIPILLCQAGKDTYVREEAGNKFAKNVPNCRLKKYKESKHELYREKDYIQRHYLEDVLNFYKDNLVRGYATERLCNV